MRGSAAIIVVIVLGGILLFLFPLILTSNKIDDATIVEIKSATDAFVQNVASKRELTQQDIDNFVLEINAKGIACEPEFKIYVLDENSEKKSAEVIVGDSSYYIDYTAQVYEKTNNQSSYKLESGYRVYCGVVQLGNTPGEQLSNWFFLTNKNANKTIASSLTIVP